jgi:Tfp pilus assembly protein PilE
MDKAETELVKLRRIFEKHYDADSTVLKSLQIDFKVVKTESKYGVFYRLKTVTSNQKRPIEHVRRLFQEKAGIKGLIF